MDKIILAHGGGGVLTDKLIKDEVLSSLGNSLLNPLEDSAVFSVGKNKMAFTTDSFVVKPLFFPGGDIGRLAVCGTVNDLAVSGAVPLYLSLSFIIEEGFPFKDLRKILKSIGETAKEAEVSIVTGDTKVVEKGSVDGIFINTAGVGLIEYENHITLSGAKAGDKILVNGYIADHGISVMLERMDIDIELPVESDAQPLGKLVKDILSVSEHIHCLKDPTRGGLSGALNEIALSSSVGITLFEEALPVRREVKGACELLGFDPLSIANEGKLIVVCPGDEAEKVLEIMKNSSYGTKPSVIGEVGEKNPGKVILETPIGGRRIIEKPYGEDLPRIC